MTSTSIRSKNLKHQLNTPQLLRSGWYLTWGISLLLLIASIYGVSSQRQALKTVGKDAAPSILTAQQLQDSFADMDASLANELLLKPENNQQPLADFEINRKKIADRLVAAAKNITYPEEEKIIQSLQWNNSAYLLKLQAARDAHKRGDKAGALSIYQSAATLMDRDIIPQAIQLSLVNSQELEKTYAQQQFANGGIGLLIAIIGAGQIAILLTIQLFLYLRMHRILNLPLLSATAIALAFTAYTLSSFLGATANLRIAKEDALDSIYALRQMRALSYKANGDESRYLLDRANAAQHEQSFNTKIKTILTIPPGFSNQNILSSLQADNTSTRLSELAGITGLFANSLKNITFVGEKELAIATFKSFNEYLAIDKKIRELNRSGKVAEAIALCVGTQPGQSNWAFVRYKKVQAELRELNQKEFDKNIKAGNDQLENFEIIAAIALGSVAILTLAGLRPRLIEYL
jgi:Four helix bundle sensory module for signal transduction